MLCIGYLGMRRLQATLEVGKRLHERPRGLARRGVDLLLGVEVPNEPRETALGGTHRLKRNMHDTMPDAGSRAAHFFARERGEVDVRENEFRVRDSLVEVCARAREYSHAAPRFIVRQREKTSEEPERGKHEDEICHGV